MRPILVLILALVVVLFGVLIAACPRPLATDARSTAGGHDVARPTVTVATDDSALTVRVLDVGQGDATLVTNGGSTVLIDGGPSPARLGELLDSLGHGAGTIDVVIISHVHQDHHGGLRELFRSSRGLTVRFIFENGDVHPTVSLRALRDSIDARVRRGATIARDADDPCGDGRPLCTITLRGGARIQIMRPRPLAGDANGRSVPIRLLAHDSTAFSMWLAGDAEHGALAWFDSVEYDRQPGMDVRVLKGNHHGSCDAIDARHLELTTPDAVVFSLASQNAFGHVHRQTTRLLTRLHIPWYRTDQNGTITIRAPARDGRPYSIIPSRGGAGLFGASDRESSQPECRGVG